MSLNASLAAASASMVLLLAPCAGMAAVAPAGSVLGPAFSYLLEGTPAAPGYTGADPVLFAALNPQPLPPGSPSPDIALDLTDSLMPVYNNPTISATNEYSVVFGVRNGACAVSYGAPTYSDGVFSFLPPDPCMPFRIGVEVAGPDGVLISPADLITLNPQPLPPGRSFSVAELSFTVAAADPMATFTLDYIPLDGSAPIPFSFSPVPEPTGLAVLGLGLLVLAGARAGRSRAVR